MSAERPGPLAARSDEVARCPLLRGQPLGGAKSSHRREGLEVLLAASRDVRLPGATAYKAAQVARYLPPRGGVDLLHGPVTAMLGVRAQPRCRPPGVVMRADGEKAGRVVAVCLVIDRSRRFGRDRHHAIRAKPLAGRRHGDTAHRAASEERCPAGRVRPAVDRRTQTRSRRRKRQQLDDAAKRVGAV